MWPTESKYLESILYGAYPKRENLQLKQQNPTETICGFVSFLEFIIVLHETDYCLRRKNDKWKPTVSAQSVKMTLNAFLYVFGVLSSM